MWVQSTRVHPSHEESHNVNFKAKPNTASQALKWHWEHKNNTALGRGLTFCNQFSRAYISSSSKFYIQHFTSIWPQFWSSLFYITPKKSWNCIRPTVQQHRWALCIIWELYFPTFFVTILLSCTYEKEISYLRVNFPELALFKTLTPPSPQFTEIHTIIPRISIFKSS